MVRITCIFLVLFSIEKAAISIEFAVLAHPHMCFIKGAKFDFVLTRYHLIHQQCDLNIFITKSEHFNRKSRLLPAGCGERTHYR